MKIGVDLDSVLADIMPPLIDFHNTHYGTKSKLEDHVVYDLTTVWKCTKEEVIERLFKFYDSPHMDMTKPIKGAQEGIDYLKSKHTLILITSRPHSIESKTIDWLDLHFPKSFNDVYHTNQVSRKGSVHKKKSQVCKEIGTQTMIEDCLEYALDVSQTGIPVYLFDSVWNQNVHLPSNITRFYEWKEIKSHL